MVNDVFDVLTAYSVVDGSSSANEVLTGSDATDVFYFQTAAMTGNDRIMNFGKNDLFVTDKKLYDGNKDGIIGMSNNMVSVDAPKKGDMVQIDGVSALRFLGMDEAGHAVYADASVRPKGAKEGNFGDNTLAGDSGNKAKNVFFFDTGLHADLGNDTITRFGKHDLIVTTTKLVDGDDDGIITATDGSFSLPDDTGSLLVKDIKGKAISSLEFDGSVDRDGHTYYVYSLVGSTAADVGDLTF
ncbi:hypothetical protein DMC47_20400 [Nostoc sp. 3335mG]|nr:hypothetical protein DMC47_20400 [Nostoc sp. 3335mG]